MPDAARCELVIYDAARQIHNSEYRLMRFLPYVKQA